MIRAKLDGLSAVLLALTGLHVPALAASFDCAKAATPLEKTICSDPKLSDLDTQLGKLYQQRLAFLSPSGAQQLRHSEKSWLHFINQTYVRKPIPNSDDTAAGRLTQQYNERLEELPAVGQKLGPFVSNRIDLFAAAPEDDPNGTGQTSGFYTQHVAYPQIDNIDTPISQTWNKQAVKEIHSFTGDRAGDDEDTDYEIGYANDKLISTLWMTSEYNHGTPHGTYENSVENSVLRPEPHDLDVSDMFGDGDEWGNKFKDLAWAALQKQGWAPPSDGAKDDILEEVTDPGSWEFTADGIKVAGFNAYDGGCYACTPQPFTLSWQEIKPLLAPDSIVP